MEAPFKAGQLVYWARRETAHTPYGTMAVIIAAGRHTLHILWLDSGLQGVVLVEEMKVL